MKKFGYVLTTPEEKSSRLMGNMLSIASGFRSKISLGNDSQTMPLAEALKHRFLDLSCGKKIMVTVEGQDEEAAVAALQNYCVRCM
ncbi:MAG: HPr family phosphocarrier protein [Clostridia bacterium]|nr:HPr family phosphocarrier protein [Clostridia bacterium]